MHKGQRLPEMHKAKYDLFNGNVVDAGGTLFAYILVTVFLIGLVISTVVFTFFSPSNVNNTIEQSVSFISCKANQEEVVLTSADKKTYVIQFIDDQFNAREIQAICDGETVVTAYSIEITAVDGDKYYSAKAIVHNGRYLLSFDETNKFHSQGTCWLIMLALGALLLCGMIMTGSIIVGRNPQKFSKKFVRLFFKDGYIKY